MGKKLGRKLSWTTESIGFFSMLSQSTVLCYSCTEQCPSQLLGPESRNAPRRCVTAARAAAKETILTLIAKLHRKKVLLN